MSKELYLVHTKMGVPFTDIKSMIIAGFKSSFQPFHEKQAALRRVGVELDKYDDNGALPQPCFSKRATIHGYVAAQKLLPTRSRRSLSSRRR